MALLLTLLDILSRVHISELTDRFVELYNAASQALSPGEQEAAQAALADRRLDNDEGHARLQARLEAAKNA